MIPVSICLPVCSVFSGNPPNSHIPNRCVPVAFGVLRGSASRSWRYRSEQSLEVWFRGPGKMAAMQA